MAILNGYDFDTRAAAVSWAATATPRAGMVIRAAGLSYRYIGSGTAISDMAGWVPNWPVTPLHFGAVGDGTTDDRPAFVEMNAAGGSVYLPKPPVAYNVATAIALDNVSVECDPTASPEALTDSGNITFEHAEFYPDSGGPVQRINGRVFVAKAADSTGNFTGTQRGMIPTDAEGANWAFRDSTLMVAVDNALMAITGFATNTNAIRPLFTPTIGVSGFVISDRDDDDAWALYGDVQLENGTNRSAIGLEIASKNKGPNRTVNPYGLNYGDRGVWLAAGGDSLYGGAPANPSAVGIVLKSNASTWNTGICFEDVAITGTDGSVGSTSTGLAIALARMHEIAWYEPTTSTKGFAIHSSVTTAANAWYAIAGARAMTFYRRSDNVVFAQIIDGGIGGLDYPLISNGSGTVSFTAQGSSANVDVFLQSKGTGVVRFGTHSAIGAETVTGYITIKDAGGTTRKLAVVS